MSRIVLASRDADFEVRIREAFDNRLNGHLRRWTDDPEAEPTEVAVELTHDAPDVVAFGADVDVEVALRVARILDRDRPEVTVMLITRPSGKLWERAMKAGVDVVIPVDAERDQLREEFERALEAADRRRENLSAEADPASRSHRVIVVTAAKGGAGKSVVATNLAVGLAHAEPERVVLVDLDLQFGDVAGGRKLVPEWSTRDATRTPDLDLTGLKVYLTPHPSGLFVLCAPPSPADADEIGPEAAARVIELLSEEFRYVVVDTSAGISEHTLVALEAATDVVLVGTMDVASVRALRKQVEVLNQVGLVRQARHFVLNRADSRVGLSLPDVEATVGLRVDVALSSSRAVPVSFNAGEPIVASDPRSSSAKELLQLVGRFAEVSSPDQAGRRLRRARAAV